MPALLAGRGAWHAHAAENAGKVVRRRRKLSRIERIERRLLAGVWLALAGLALFAWRSLPTDADPVGPHLPTATASAQRPAAASAPAPALVTRTELGLPPARIAPPPPAADRTSPVQEARDRPAARPAMPAKAPARVPEGTPARPAVALLLDDFGHALDPIARTLALPAPVAMAFLPYPARTAEGAALARAAGREVLLHLPMQPRDPGVDPGPVVLRVDMDAPALLRTLDAALAAVPGTVGVNNHMGSLFTADRRGMEVVMEALAGRGLWFVDSRTTPDSVAVEAAGRFGVPVAVRDVFIDNEQDVAAVLARLDEAERVARRRGAALAIGHPHPATLAALERWIPQARRRGVVFWTVARYIAWRCSLPAFSRSAACVRHIAERPRRPG